MTKQFVFRIENSHFFKIFYFFVILTITRFDAACMNYRQIEGVVINADLGIPLIQANVKLKKYDAILNSFLTIGTTKTDNLGKFCFNELSPGIYIIKSSKQGFLSNIPDYLEKVIDGANINDIQNLLNVFSIGIECPKKFVKIVLKTGHSINGKILGIPTESESGYSLSNVVLIRGVGSEEKAFFMEQQVIEICRSSVGSDGSFEFSELEPRNDYILEIITIGFPIQYYKDIDIISTKSVSISLNYNKNDKTGVKGIVRINGNIPKWFSLYLDKNEEGDVFPYYCYDYQNLSITNPNADYSISMVSADRYYISIFAFDENNKMYKKRTEIKIDPNVYSIVDFLL
jgi:hypothetical protein